MIPPPTVLILEVGSKGRKNIVGVHVCISYFWRLHTSLTHDELESDSYDGEENDDMWMSPSNVNAINVIAILSEFMMTWRHQKQHPKRLISIEIRAIE